MLILTVAASLMLAQAAEPAAPKPAPPAKAAKAEKPPKPKRICWDEVSTGSLMPNRICRTKEQIDADARAAQETGRAVGDQYAQCGGRPC